MRFFHGSAARRVAQGRDSWYILRRARGDQAGGRQVLRESRNSERRTITRLHGRETVRKRFSYLCGAFVVTLAATYAATVAAETGKKAFADVAYPRIAMLWSPIRGDRSLTSYARHDLIMAGVGSFRLRYDREPSGLADGFTPESIKNARERIASMRKDNPRAVILGDLPFYEYPDGWLPEDHPWWLRVNGERKQFWPGTHRMNWYNTEYQEHLVAQTAALKEVGVDGVFYDNVRNEPDAWVPFLQRVRKAVGDDFLILANAGYAVGSYDFAAPYLNGIMYESGWSHNRTEWDDCIRKMQHTQTLLREPKISIIERFEETRSRAGWPGDPKRGEKPPADPQARRWSLCYALTIGDFYYLFSDNTSHRHDWHPEYDAKIGLPLERGRRIGPHVWERKYEKARVVVNLPGATESHTVTLGHPAIDTLSGRRDTRFVIPPGDGCVLLSNAGDGGTSGGNPKRGMDHNPE